MESELQFHKNRNFVSYLCGGFRNGFDTLVSDTDLEQKELKNLVSARSQPDVVNELLHKELQKNFMFGPFKIPPFEKYRVSPIGVATGKYSGKHRLIIDLSSPHNNSKTYSINSLIDKEQCSLSYIKIDDAINIIQSLGKGAQLCKFDIQDAFKLLPILPKQLPLFCIKWNKKYYVLHRLAMGCRSSPFIFDHLSQAVCWIAKNRYEIHHILHLLDDFLTIDKTIENGLRSMAIMTMLFKKLGIPLSEKKVEGPTSCLEYLGIILDTQKMEARLPREKVTRIIEFIHTIIQKRSCTKREILQLLGHLNFACRVILPGRSFVSYLINLSTTVTELHHYVHLNKECKEDLYMWLKFLEQWNGLSVFYDKQMTSSIDMKLFTDASSTCGYGGYYNKQWFCSAWPSNLPSVSKNLSMAFLELYPIVVAAILWGHLWIGKRVLFMCDNQATVEIINKGRSKTIEIMGLMRKLTWVAAKSNFFFKSKYISTLDNSIADSLSRFQMERFRELVPEANLKPCTCPQLGEVIWSSPTR